MPIMESDKSRIHLSSMFEDYVLDIKALNVERKHYMKKYHYNHKRTGVDKRRELSLDEFYDVYDAKW